MGIFYLAFCGIMIMWLLKLTLYSRLTELKDTVGLGGGMHSTECHSGLLTKFQSLIFIII